MRATVRLGSAPRRTKDLGKLVAIVGITTLALGTVQPASGAGAGVIGWVVECDFVRHLPDDPIVHPGHSGMSHLHAFFGNVTTDAFSTQKSLLAGSTSCGLAADTGAYWNPAAYVGGKLVQPLDTDFYYRVLTDPARVKPFPAGLEIIAGNGKAVGPQSKKIVDWDCENGGDSTDRDGPIDCGTGIVASRIKFPDCWDGRQLDSADHKSHMAYSVDGPGSWTVCPATHPVPVPKLLYKLEWPVHDGRTLTLSSGLPYTMHADFVNSWKQADLATLVTRCINARTNCGKFNTPN